jgi:hypothetical protein
MIITKRNSNNSEVFLKYLPNQHYILLIIVKKLIYLPKFTYKNQVLIFITEEDEITDKESKYTEFFPNAKFFFNDELHKYLKTHSNSGNFSENILKNLYKHTEKTINTAAEYAAIANIKYNNSNMNSFLVITATENYPDAMILLKPATPEFQEKTHIKEIICYPNMI